MGSRQLSRQQASDAVTGMGWRFVLGTVVTEVRVESLAQAAAVAEWVAALGTAEVDVRIDLRVDRVLITLRDPATDSVTERETELAGQISTVLDERGLRTEPGVGTPASRSVQLLELAIDAMDIAAIRPFWKAVMGYADEGDRSGPTDPLVDPGGQGPAVWFQQMDMPRPQRNRIHFDVSVPHDEAGRRIAAALAAGGVMVSAGRAPAFWVLADVEGNEACVTTWQRRD
ncbi:MAG TPA: VOC family protein [Mycobacteriales bacterium]|nr:VOC family protein [Mycobacteriales bacterium]